MARRGKEAFLLNLWVCPDTPEISGQPRWRGSIEDLATKQRLYFSGLNDLVAYLSARIGGAGRPAENDR